MNRDVCSTEQLLGFILGANVRKAIRVEREAKHKWAVIIVQGLIRGAAGRYELLQRKREFELRYSNVLNIHHHSEYYA